MNIEIALVHKVDSGKICKRCGTKNSFENTICHNCNSHFHSVRDSQCQPIEKNIKQENSEE